MINEKDLRHVKNALLAIKHLEEFSSEHPINEAYEDYRISDVLLMEFENLANEIFKLSNEYFAANENIPLIQLKAIRNRIAHDYLSVSLDVLYTSIEIDFPRLKSILINSTK